MWLFSMGDIPYFKIHLHFSFSRRFYAKRFINEEAFNFLRAISDQIYVYKWESSEQMFSNQIVQC